MTAQNEEVHQHASVRRTLADYTKPSLKGLRPSVIRPTVQARNFTIPPQIITMIQNSVQFDGLPEEEPNAHVALFLEVCDTFKIHGVSDDAIKLRLFPFSLRDRAKSWLNSLPAGSITTWENMAEKFLFRYFPPSKTARLRNNIHAFLQDDEESLYEAWDRFKELLRKCPYHGLELWQQVQTFYNGLNTQTRQTVDIIARGSLSNKTPEEAFDLFEELAMDNYQWPKTRSTTTTQRQGVHQVDSNIVLAAQVEALSRKIDHLRMNNFQGCEICGGPHVSADCEHGGTFNFHQLVASSGFDLRRKTTNTNDSTSNKKSITSTYYQPDYFQQTETKPQQHYVSYDQRLDNTTKLDQKPSLEHMISQYHNEIQQRHKALIDKIEELISYIRSSVCKQQSVRLLRHQKKNPEEHVKVVTMWRDRAIQVDKPTITSKSAIENKETESPCKVQDTRLCPARITLPKETVIKYMPYPGRPEKEKLEEQYEKFLKRYKQLHTNLPLMEDLAKLPKYAMFLKDLLTNKKKTEKLSIVTMNKECSAILQNKLPQKKTDPGSFTIPCLIGSLSLTNALADLGASINLMPYSVFTKLDLGEPNPTCMCIQLADKSLKYPRGVVENLLVKIDRFVFPVDFVILDMDEDDNVPLILGRPFLATSRAMIDVFGGMLTLRVDDDSITFKIKNSMRHTQGNDDSLYFVSTIMSHVGRFLQEIRGKDTLDTQNLGRVNRKIKLISSVTEEVSTPLASKSPMYPKVFEVIERQEPKSKESIVETLSLELKVLSSHLGYVFLDDGSKLPNIIPKDLTVDEKDNLLTMLEKHTQPTTSKIMDIKGINLFVCMHKILMEEEVKHLGHYQRSLGPNWQVVVKKARVLQLTIDHNYASKTLIDVKYHYITSEKELLTLLRHLFRKQDACTFVSKTIVSTDNATLRRLFRNQDAKPRNLQWILLLQEFDVEICDNKEAKSVTANHRSQLLNLNMEECTKL